HVVGRAGGDAVDLDPLHVIVLHVEGWARRQWRSRRNGTPSAAGRRAERPRPARTASATTYGIIWIPYELTGSRKPCTRSWSASAAPKRRQPRNVPRGIQRPTMMAASAM